MSCQCTTRLIHLPIIYTYNGLGAADFSPGTLTAMNASSLGFYGWARPPALYRAEGEATILDSANDSVVNGVGGRRIQSSPPLLP
jgi:hypothetical protein